MGSLRMFNKLLRTNKKVKYYCNAAILKIISVCIFMNAEIDTIHGIL